MKRQYKEIVTPRTDTPVGGSLSLLRERDAHHEPRQLSLLNGCFL